MSWEIIMTNGMYSYEQAQQNIKLLNNLLTSDPDSPKNCYHRTRKRINLTSFLLMFIATILLFTFSPTYSTTPKLSTLILTLIFFGLCGFIFATYMLDGREKEKTKSWFEKEATKRDIVLEDISNLMKSLEADRVSLDTQIRSLKLKLPI